MEIVWKIFLTVLCSSSIYGFYGHEYSELNACTRDEPCQPNSLLANWTDCKKYWQCLESGTWVDRECPENGRFDYSLRYCVHTGNATCHPGCPNVTCELPLPCKPNTIIPEPEDCQHFHQCSTGGSWSHGICLNGTQFDHLSLKCSPEAMCISTCQVLLPNRTEAIQSQTNNTREEISGEIVWRMADPCNTTLPCEPGAIAANTHFCSRYNKCLSDGTWKSKTCAEGGMFDYKKGYCVQAENASCHPLCPEDLNCERQVPCSINQVIVPDPFDCQKFYQCDTSGSWARISCLDGLYFDMRAHVCKKKSDVECHPECQLDPCKPLPELCPKEGIKVPVVNNCHKFHQCQSRDGSWVVLNCGNQDKFDHITEECRPDAVCHPGCSVPTPPTTSTIARTTAQSTVPDSSVVISHTMEQVTPGALEGHPVEFQCYVMVRSGVSAQAISWFLQGLKISGDGRKFTLNETREDGVHETIWTATLHIDPVQNSDNGQVNCSFTSTDGLHSSADGNLEVLAKPVVYVSEMSRTVLRGDNIKLNFTLANTPADGSHLTWYKNNKVLSEWDNENVVRISSHEYMLEVWQIEKDTSYGCVATNRAGESDKAMCEIVITKRGDDVCPLDCAAEINWPLSAAGRTSKQVCPGNATGVATRRCNGSDRGAEWEEPNLNHCVDPEYQEIMTQVDNLESGLGIESPQVITAIAQRLEELTQSGKLANNTMKPGNLNVTVAAAFKLGAIHELKSAAQATEEETQSIVHSASNLLSEENCRVSWGSVLKEDRERGVFLMSTLDRYSSYLARLHVPGNLHLKKDANRAKNINSDNIVLTSDLWKTGNLTYPSSDASWLKSIYDKAVVSEDTLSSIANAIQKKELLVSNIYYRTLQLIQPVKSEQQIPSRVMTVSIEDMRKDWRLDTPIHLQFANNLDVQENDERTCSFWKYTGTASGAWSGAGCNRTYADENITTCECDHLTNFAILVTRYRPTDDHHYVLSLLTTIGLSISIVCMFITLIIYILLWKSIKSDYALMLMNICGALIVANFVFLVAISQTRLQVLCAVIAAALHYLFLAAFFLMLAEAVELLLYVVYVFHVHTPRETTGLLIAAWGTPLLIVGITLAITQGHGYGNNEFCWLTLERGVIWAFLGPIIALILINFCILGKVLMTLFASGKLRNEKQSDRIRTTAWNVLVLSPTLGLSWTFGLFAMNEKTLAFQYIFTSLNAFQGLFIFIFHCLFNKRIRDAFRDKYFKDVSISFSSSSSWANKARLRKGSLASKFASSDTQCGISGNFRLNEKSRPGEKTASLGETKQKLNIEYSVDKTPSITHSEGKKDYEKDIGHIGKEDAETEALCTSDTIDSGAQSQCEETIALDADNTKYGQTMSYDNLIFSQDHANIRV